MASTSPGTLVSPQELAGQKRRKPTEYEVVDCTRGCTLGAEKLGPKLYKVFHSWFEQGLNDYEISKRGDQLGHHVSYGACARHRRRHLVRKYDPSDDDPLAEAPIDKVSHVETLERIIAIGAGRLNPAKISPDTVLKAMEMHNRLTQGRALDETFAAITAAMSQAGTGAPLEDADSGEANREAIKTPAELAEEMASLD